METNQVPQMIDVQKFFEAILNWPLQTKIGLSLSLLIWLIGGSLVFYSSLKRQGIPYWKTLLPTPSAWRALFNLNGSEGMKILLIASISLAIGIWGIAGAH